MEEENTQTNNNIDEYANFLDSKENPFKFVTPENSSIIKLLRKLKKDGDL